MCMYGFEEIGRDGVPMETRLEITRAVSMLRSLLRIELVECGRAMRRGDIDRAETGIAEAREKLVRAINVLNRLR